MLLPPEHGAENIGENNTLAFASAAVDKSYIGWWSAAAYHGFTTQKPMAVTVAVFGRSRLKPSRARNQIRQSRAAQILRLQTYDVYGRNGSYPNLKRRS